MMADIVTFLLGMLITSASRAASGAFVEYISCHRRLRRRSSGASEDAAIARVETIQLYLPIECECSTPCALAQSLATSRVERKGDDPSRHCIDVVGRYGDRIYVIAQVIGHTAGGRRDNGESARHRLEDDETEGLSEGRE
jgi:hypothetical protein